MAMTTCKECGKEISTTAAACPHCGAKPYKPSGCMIVVIAGAALLLISSMIDNKPAPPPKTAEQLAQDASKEAAFQKVVGALQTIKRTNRNPNSVTWESVRANDDASLICVEFRGQNGFGGMSREFVIYVKNKATQSTEAWNGLCTKPLTDMIHARQAL